MISSDPRASTSDGAGPRRGVRLGVDVGGARVGVARSDPSGLLATPVETVPRGRGDLARIAALAAEHDAVEVVVGLPRSLSGREGTAAEAARDYAVRLARRLRGSGHGGDAVPVRLVDERLSTVTAERGLREAGISGRRATAVRRRVVDQAAAVVILQAALDEERSTGRPPGREVAPAAPPGGDPRVVE